MTSIQPPCTNILLPIRDALELLGGKWKLPIIAALLPGSKRFKELQRELGPITAKTLARELREMEAHQLLTRQEFATAPPAVTYALTPYSRTLEKVVETLYQWGSEHRRQIMERSGEITGPGRETGA